jgi:hypothetical protein
MQPYWNFAITVFHAGKTTNARKREGHSVSDIADLLKTLRRHFDPIAVTAGCGLFILFEHWGWVPALPSWMIGLAWFGFLLFGSVLALDLIGLIAFAVQLFVLWMRRGSKKKEGRMGRLGPQCLSSPSPVTPVAREWAGRVLR